MLFQEDEEKILLKEQKQKEKEKAQLELLKQEAAKESTEENNANVGLLKIIEEEKIVNVDSADPEDNQGLAANISDIVSSTASVKVINVQVNIHIPLFKIIFFSLVCN